MYVVGHDDEVAQPIPLAIKMAERVSDDVSQSASLQHACAVALIEMFEIPLREQLMKLILLSGRKRQQ